MSKRTPLPAVIDWPQAVGLYHKVLAHFYERDDAAKAAPYALKLLRAVQRLDPKAESLAGNEYRALIAEVDGDYNEAIHYRRRELRLLDRLIKTGRLEAVRLSWEDYSDRLDLLALDYFQAGRLNDAWRTIRRSETVCRAAGIAFDGADVKADIARERSKASRRANSPAAPPNGIGHRKAPKEKQG